MVRTPYIDENGLKKGAWSREEDNKLVAYIQKNGPCNWSALPKYAGIARCGKSCRLRWVNYLKPNVKHGNYTKEEQDLIIKLHEQLGNRWSKIAAKLPGRTDNEIKNYWHTHLKKHVQQQETTKRIVPKRKSNRNSQKQEIKINYHNDTLHHNVPKINPSVQILESCPLSPPLSGTESSNLSLTDTSSIINNDHNYGITSTNLVAGLEETTMSYSFDAVGELADGRFWSEPFVLETCQLLGDPQLNFPDCGFSSPNMSYLEVMDFPCIFSEAVLLKEIDGSHL